MLAKKPTKFMINSWLIGRELKRKCDGTHEHQPLIDGRAKDAARYPPALCRAICRGITKEKMKGACRLTPVMAVGDAPHAVNVDPEEEHERDEADIASLIRELETQEKRFDRRAGVPERVAMVRRLREPWPA